MRYLFPLSQWNGQRQFQKPVWVYPVHLAMYATYLRNEGHEVMWGNDGSIHEHSCQDCGIRWAHETGNGWCKIDDSKGEGYPCGICIFNHVVGFSSTPEGAIEIDETLRKQKETANKIGNNWAVIKDDFQINVPFEKLPFPDRTFTDAKNKRWQSYGNYKFHPATHTMASNLCWWGKCTFCVDTLKLQQGEKRGLRTVSHCIDEIDNLIHLGFRECFDDSGTFPIGVWLEEFCKEMIKKGRNKKIVLGCNMKPIAEKVVPFKLMKEAGFRFILVGVESANQKTIDLIKKGQDSDKVIENMKSMNDAGLEVHLTSMFGYSWETHEDSMNTVRLVHHLLKKGYVKTAQASVYSPPRTKPNPNSHGHKYIPMIYDAYKSPEFWLRKIQDIKKWQDFTYLFRGGRLVLEEKWRKLIRKPS